MVSERRGPCELASSCCAPGRAGEVGAAAGKALLHHHAPATTASSVVSASMVQEARMASSNMVDVCTHL